MVPITVPGWTRLPSGSRSDTTIRGSTSSQARRAQSVPAMTPGSRETSATRGRLVGADGGVAGEVTGAAEVLQQRRPDERLDHDAGQ